MEVILLKEHESLGEIGDIVNVKPGYARNFLFPRGIAVRSSKRNVALAAEQKKTAQKQADRDLKANEEIVKLLKKVEISIEVETGDEEKMFGSITNLDVHKELTAKGFELEKSQIVIEEPIKALGIYHAKVKVAKDVTSDVKLYVIKG